MFSIPFLFLVAIAPVLADTNSWTKPDNGFWEEQAYWSLGMLPDATQDVLFDNAGLKALAIGPQTAQNFPQSMSVQSLRVGAPVDSFNTLLMAFSGFEQPLQTGSLTVDPNGAVVMQGSSLHVLQGGLPYEADLFILGNFSQGDFSQVDVDGRLRVNSGGYFLTNGTLTVNFLLEDWGKFVQYGGANNSGSLHVEESGEYDLYEGEVQGFLRVSDHGSFFQQAGNVTADVDVGFDYSGGLYVLNGGTLTGQMTVPSARGSGAVQQSGGTNFAVSLTIGNGSRFGGWGSYVLSNGVVAVSSSTTLRALGTFDQWDGAHSIASNLVMRGSDLGALGGIAPAVYTLRNGTLSAMSLSMWIASFDQEGGSNLISGDMVTGPPLASNGGRYTSLYRLNGGVLSASNVTLIGSLQGGNFLDNGGFDQTGGTNVITGDLLITGTSANFQGYTLTGGSLSVNNISISNGATCHHSGGVINHSGVVTLAGGNWQARPGEQTLGLMRLASGDSSEISSIDFPDSPSVLRLANSRDEAWSPTANLYVNNWHGSTSGGGETRLFFGSKANGLTPEQLALIKFSLPGGLYPARRLSTGEVVPQMRH